MADAAEDIADLSLTASPVTGNRKLSGDGGPTAALPHFFPARSTDGIPRINQQTFIRFLDGEFNDKADEKLIIDCRFDYEYKGGHVEGADWIDDTAANTQNNNSMVPDWLFTRPTSSHLVIVLYCEFSLLRAPATAACIRSRDRERNPYPRLTYPDVYVLEGGYSSFFYHHPNRCVPEAYIHMSDAAHGERSRLRIDQLRRMRHDKQLGRHRSRRVRISKFHSHLDAGEIRGRLLLDTSTQEGFRG